MDQRPHSQGLTLTREGPVILLAIALATVLPGVFLFHREPSFSPEDYVYAALGGDLRASIAFLLDFRQENYRPLSHGLVYVAMAPFYIAYGSIAFAWLLTILKFSVAASFYAVLRSWRLRLVPALTSVGLLLVSGGWLSMHLWNALAINILLFQLGLIVFLYSVVAQRPVAWLSIATFLSSSAYSIGAVFPFAFALYRYTLGEKLKWREILPAIPAGICGWIGLGNSLHRRFTTDGFADLSSTLVSGSLSYHQVPLGFDPVEIIGRLMLALSLRLAEFFPFFRPLAQPAWLGAFLFLAVSVSCLFFLRRFGHLRMALALLWLMTALNLPFCALLAQYNLRYNWPADLLFCVFLGICVQAWESHHKWVSGFAVAFIFLILLLPSPKLEGMHEGMRKFRRTTKNLEDSIRLEPFRKGKMICLPDVVLEPINSDETPLSLWLRRMFYLESMRGIVLSLVLAEQGNLGAAIDQSNLKPRCEVRMRPPVL